MAVAPIHPSNDAGRREPPPAADDGGAVATFMQLERRARQAETPDALRFVMVNETRRLVAYRQAILVLGDAGGARVAAVSNVAEIDRNAPFVRWVLALYRAVARGDEADAARAIERSDAPDRLGAEWAEWAPGNGFLLPLADRHGHRIGAVILFRDTRWTEAETVMLDRLGECYAHAWAALGRGRRSAGGGRRRFLRAAAVVAALAALAALFLPVPQTALAPATVVARDPVVMAAPLDGVIAEFLVEPNQLVEIGTPLFRFEDTDLRAVHAVAARTLEVARAELRRATQQAFGDPESSAQVALLKARVRVREAELAHAEEKLGRVLVRADAAGLTVFADANDWIGRPVATGERILQVADPKAAELLIDLPVADAIALEEGARVDLFLDVDPLEPRRASMSYAAYEAEPTPAGVLAYRVIAAFDETGPPPRIGLHGTAKIHGQPVPLAYYLFRRPIAGARQFLGL